MWARSRDEGDKVRLRKEWKKLKELRKEKRRREEKKME